MKSTPQLQASLFSSLEDNWIKTILCISWQKASVVNNEEDDPDHFDTAFIDSTVQEKNITFPADANLHKRLSERF